MQSQLHNSEATILLTPRALQSVCQWLKLNLWGRLRGAEPPQRSPPPTMVVCDKLHCWVTGLNVALRAAHEQSPSPIVSWKPSLCSSASQSEPLQSCINQALMLLNHPTGMSGMRNGPYVDVGSLPGGGLRRWRLSLLQKASTLALCGYSQCSLPGYLIKSQQIISPNSSCGYSNARTHTV